jgi:hypothetical protein
MRFRFLASRPNGHRSQGVVDSRAALQKGAEYRSIRKKSSESDISLLLLISGQGGIGLRDLREELPVLSHGRLRCRKRRRRRRLGRCRRGRRSILADRCADQRHREQNARCGAESARSPSLYSHRLSERGQTVIRRLRRHSSRTGWAENRTIGRVIVVTNVGACVIGAGWTYPPLLIRHRLVGRNTGVGPARLGVLILNRAGSCELLSPQRRNRKCGHGGRVRSRE